MSDQPNDIEAIFVTALGKGTPEERAAYLDEACGDDAGARARVEALLDAHDDAGSFLEKPAAQFVPTAGPAESTGDAGESSVDGQPSLDFLAPTESPGCLGRIGQYEITEVVGRGGMGVVLKGYDPKLSRVVAVKVLAPELASNASARKRFLREGRAAAAVSHDHVVTIYGIDDSGSLPFIAMEYISGPSLEDRIRGEGSLELTEILRIGMQIASGLSAAHAQGLVHRDVKPANILLENGVEKVKITDFGLARAVDDVRMTKPGVVTGTPEYMSPEQARGESVDHRTDLFSLGSVLYAMCTGRSPFRAENTVAMIRRVCEDTPRPIQDVNPEIPGWLVQIIDELLAKPAPDRFQSPAELTDLLGRCLAHVQEPSINPLPDALEGHKGARRARRMTRHRRWPAAAAILLVALGGLSLTEATGVTNVAGTVIRIVRGDGTLVIHVDDPEVSVSIDGEQLVITGAGAKEIRLAVGQHELKAVKDGKPVRTEWVTITRDGKQVVRVNAEPLPASEVAEAPKPEERAGIELQDVWSFPGLDDLDVLAISRDGRYCAFTDPERGGLVVRDLTTGKDQRSTESTAYPVAITGFGHAHASISPDNKWVAYKAWSGDTGYCDLRMLGIDGSHERVLYRNEEKSRIMLCGWSADSQHVLARFREPDGSGRIATISVADGSTRVLKSLTPEESPGLSLSPGGRYVAYERVMDTASEQEDIFLIPLDGGPEIPLVQSPADDDVFGWLPDGKGFLFRSNRREAHDVWMIQVVDGKPQGVPRLVKKRPPSFYCSGPVRTPPGGWAFYYTQWRRATKSVSSVSVGTLDPNTGKLLTAPELITQSAAGRERVLCPDFSRDGKYLAYYVAPAYEQTSEGWRCPPGNIVIRTLETGEEREITLSPKLSVRGVGRLRWAPDGRSILTQGRIETGHQGIFRLDIETGRLHPVVTRKTANWQQLPEAAYEFVAYGEWSSDGKTVFYIRGRKDRTKGLVAEALVAHDLETGREREVYRDPDGEFEVVGAVHAVSPDGQRVVIEDKRSLKILPSTGGEPRVLLNWENRAPVGIAWTPDSRFLLCARAYQGRPELWRIAADGGDPERVDEFPPALGTVYDVRVHPDGRRIAFVSVRPLPQWRIGMLQIVLSDEMAKEMCKANLRRIGKAIQQYRSDHGDAPDWLSDLYPDYLQDKWLLVCPADSRAGKPSQFSHPRDPKMRCSYGYQFSPEIPSFPRLNALPADFPAREGMTWKDVRKLQLEYYGPVVPVATCKHRDWSVLLFLGYDGDIYESNKGFWESSPQAKAGLLSRLRSAMQSEPATWVQRYDTQRFACVLEDEAALTKFLKTHLKDHPEDEAAREFLAELPRLRFPCGSRDDAEENVDDGSVDQWDNFELIHDADDDEDQVVGIRFPDIPVPQGARIKRAYLQFTALTEDAGSDKTDLVLHAELAANAEPFAEVKYNITSRRKTAASVQWSPEPWTAAGERSEKQRTPDLSPLIQEVVDQPGWRKGNSLVLVIAGSGRRVAESCDGGWSGTPMLYVEH